MDQHPSVSTDATVWKMVVVKRYWWRGLRYSTSALCTCPATGSDCDLVKVAGRFCQNSRARSEPRPWTEAEGETNRPLHVTWKTADLIASARHARTCTHRSGRGGLAWVTFAGRFGMGLTSSLMALLLYITVGLSQPGAVVDGWHLKDGEGAAIVSGVCHVEHELPWRFVVLSVSGRQRQGGIGAGLGREVGEMGEAKAERLCLIFRHGPYNPAASSRL